jgi:hypothetical protein
MTSPTPVKISKAHAKALANLTIQIEALQRTIKMIVDEGERRNAKYIDTNKSLWSEIALTYGIDIKNVIWHLDEQNCQIIPKQINLEIPQPK